MAKINHVTTVEPPHSYTTAEVRAEFERRWFPELPIPVRRKMQKLFEAGQIERRCSVVPLDLVLGGAGLRERNEMYRKAMIELGRRALAQAIEASGTKPEEIGAVISTSCTGFMIPSVDAYLVDLLGLPSDVLRLPVTEMGCAGGTSGLIYARSLLGALPPGKKIALLSLEAPSLTFLRGDHSAENLVSASIFADGVACVIVGADGPGPDIVDTAMYHFPESTHLMGYQLRDDGFKIVLDREIPSAIGARFRSIVEPFLARNGVGPADVDHYVLHPGGKKILHMIEDYAASHGRDAADSRHVLETRGNMSSATVLHILERTLARAKADELGYMLAFGPGFTAQSLLLRFDANGSTCVRGPVRG